MSLLGIPVAVSAADWTGFYVGGSLGGRTANSDWKTVCLEVATGCIVNTLLPDQFANANPSRFSSTGIRVGGHLGYGLQLQDWVVGLEGDLGWANNERDRKGIPGAYLPGAATTDRATIENSWDASIRARGGFLVKPDLLLYATGGVSWLHKTVRASCNTPAFPVGWCITPPNKESVSTTPVGWTAGAGLEWMFTSNWSVRGEYRYAGYESNEATLFRNNPIDAIRVRTDQSTHTITLGFSFRFH